MALPRGAQVGPYEIAAQIGAGGMGEVYRAVDRNLGRSVAIKILPDGFTEDSERLARFEREARTLAALNHPNIATIHGLERIPASTPGGPMPALVMELVEGPTLADRIAAGPLDLNEALAIARQIAAALEAAHEQGIIHRDLKPANIKLREDGAVKILDFGLAKPGAGSIGASPTPLQDALSPTVTSPAMTLQGVILGTAAYMSPEQAKGRIADKRSDLWAFGCVLFEMLTGKRAFEGDTVSETLASVLRSEPDWSALPDHTPPAVATLNKQLLEKDRRKRVGDIAAVIFVLDHRLTDVHTIAAVRGAPPHRLAFATVVVLVAAAAAAVAWWISARSRVTDPKPVTRFTIALSGDEVFGAYGSRLLDVSPDGRHIAYIANRRLNLRALERLDPVPIRGTEGAVATDPPVTSNPTFSPDGRWIAFWHQGQLKKVAVEGGAHVVIASAANASAFSWGPDGTLLFAASGAIWRVSENGGTPEKVLEGLNGRVQRVELLPGNRALLYTLFPPGSISTTEVVVQSLDGGNKQTLSTTGIEARYLETGHIVFYDAGSLLAVPFDVDALSVRGAAVPVAENVASTDSPGRAASAAHFAVSRTGTLAYMNGMVGSSFPRTLVWVDRSGREEAFTDLPPRAYVYPRLSPAGNHIALTIGDEDRDIWIWDFALATLRRFTHDPATERYAIWTPDGKRLLFGSSRDNQAATWWQSADGVGVAERVAAAPSRRFNNFVPTTITADGSRMVVTATGPGTEGGAGADLWLVTMGGAPRAEPLLATAAVERNAEISPDGRWMAYETVEREQSNVWVRPFPDVNGGRWQVSTQGGSQPAWARDGRELFFRDLSGVLMSVPVESRSTFVFGTPVKVLAGPYVYSVATYAGRLYDVAPDGKRFLMMKTVADVDRNVQAAGLTVVQNWFEDLKRLAPPK